LANLGSGFAQPLPIVSSQPGETIDLVQPEESSRIRILHANLFSGASYLAQRADHYLIDLHAGEGRSSADFDYVLLGSPSPETAGGAEDNRLESDTQSPADDPSYDVNGDGTVSPVDALLVINRLNAPLAGRSSSAVLDRQLDVNGDQVISPVDALLVINKLNRPTTRAPQPAAAGSNASLPQATPKFQGALPIAGPSPSVRAIDQLWAAAVDGLIGGDHGFNAFRWLEDGPSRQRVNKRIR
jgi:hypothetical protein